MLSPLNAMINLSGLMKKKFEKLAAENSDNERKSSLSSINKSLYQVVSDSSSVMRVINNSAILMKYLVQDFLDLVNLQRGSLLLIPKMDSVTEICSQVLELFEV